MSVVVMNGPPSCLGDGDQKTPRPKTPPPLTPIMGRLCSSSDPSGFLKKPPPRVPRRIQYTAVAPQAKEKMSKNAALETCSNPLGPKSYRHSEIRVRPLLTQNVISF